MPIFEYQCPVCRRVEERIELAGEELDPPLCVSSEHQPVYHEGEIVDRAVAMQKIPSAAGVMVIDHVLSGLDHGKIQGAVNKELVRRGDNPRHWGMHVDEINMHINPEE